MSGLRLKELIILLPCNNSIPQILPNVEFLHRLLDRLDLVRREDPGHRWFLTSRLCSLNKSCVEIKARHPISSGAAITQDQGSHFAGGPRNRRAMMIRTLITAVAVTAALAAPTLAQTRYQVQPRKPDIGSYGSFGTIGPRTVHRSPYSVYSIRGNYIGADPDPTVRHQLQHDPTQGGGGR